MDDWVWNGVMVAVCVFFTGLAWAFFQRAKDPNAAELPAHSRLLGYFFSVFAVILWLGALNQMGALPARVSAALAVLTASGEE